MTDISVEEVLVADQFIQIEDCILKNAYYNGRVFRL